MCRVCLCGRQADLLDLAADKIIAIGGTCLTSVSELDSLEAAEAIVERARKTFRQLDILILVSPFWAGGQIHDHRLKLGILCLLPICVNLF